VLRQEGLGAIAFTPLAQGLLTDKYLHGGAADRAQNRNSVPADRVSDRGRTILAGLNEIARQRGQSLAQMAIQWVLRDPVVTSALIGASRPAQLDENLAALEGPAFDTEEIEQIDTLTDGIDLSPSGPIWADASAS